MTSSHRHFDDMQKQCSTHDAICCKSQIWIQRMHVALEGEAVQPALHVDAQVAPCGILTTLQIVAMATFEDVLFPLHVKDGGANLPFMHAIPEVKFV